MLDEVAGEANIMHRRALMLELEKSVKIKTGLRCTEITSEGVMAVDKDFKEMLFEADSIIVAVGLKSRSDLVDALQGVAPEFMAIGDCVKPKKVMQAVRTGYDAAMSI
jgi:thioredoxin reductase